MGVPRSASNDISATEGEIITVEAGLKNGEVACTTTTMPTSVTDEASA
jgi:hypothetical protein